MERGPWEWRETEMAKEERSGEGWKLTGMKGEMEEELTPMVTPDQPEGEGRENQEKWGKEEERERGMRESGR